MTKVCSLLVSVLALAANAAAQSVELTLPTQGAQVSVTHPFVITWKAANLPDHPMLSLRFLTTEPTSSRLITSLLTDADTRTLFAQMKTLVPPSLPVLESGTYSWDLATFCPKNTSNGKSVCQPGHTFQIEAILRDRGDPCADNHDCRTPRPYYISVVSPGVFTFSE